MSIAKAQVVKLAKQMFGKNAIVEENSRALDAEGRKVETEAIARRRERVAQLDPIIQTEISTRRLVIQAARRVVENCSVGAVKEMAAALASYKVIEDAIAEKKQLVVDGRKVSCCSRRCNVGEYSIVGGIPMSFQAAAGDTWEEVLVELKEKRAKKS